MRKTLRTIVVPIDFSETAEAALDYAVELASKLDAKLHVVHVIALPAIAGDLGFALTASMIDSITRDSAAALDKLVTARSSRVAMGAPVLRSGDARTEIVAAATQLGADMVVMGTHGRRGLSRALMGSVAENVARTATCPVLLVRDPGHA